MEEPSNGKIEETRKVEPLEKEEEEEEEVVKEVEQLKIQEETPEERVDDGNELILENSISVEEKVEEEKKGLLEEEEEEEKEGIKPSLESSEADEGMVQKSEEDGKIWSLEVKDGLGEEGVVVLEGKEGGEASGNVVEEIVQKSTNVDVVGVGSSDAVPENVGTTTIVSLSQRAGQPTSWRSCCGLLEALGRSNR